MACVIIGPLSGLKVWKAASLVRLHAQGRVQRCIQSEVPKYALDLLAFAILGKVKCLRPASWIYLNESYLNEYSAAAFHRAEA